MLSSHWGDGAGSKCSLISAHVDNVRIPIDVAQDSEMISPTIPI